MDNTRILELVISTLEQIEKGEKSTVLLKTCIDQLQDAKKINALNFPVDQSPKQTATTDNSKILQSLHYQFNQLLNLYYLFFIDLDGKQFSLNLLTSFDCQVLIHESQLFIQSLEQLKKRLNNIGHLKDWTLACLEQLQTTQRTLERLTTTW